MGLHTILHFEPAIVPHSPQWHYVSQRLPNFFAGIKWNSGKALNHNAPRDTCTFLYIYSQNVAGQLIYRLTWANEGPTATQRALMLNGWAYLLDVDTTQIFDQLNEAAQPTFDIGQRVQVQRQSYGLPAEGIVVDFALENYLIYFVAWGEGHNGGRDPVAIRQQYGNNNCYYVGARDLSPAIDYDLTSGIFDQLQESHNTDDDDLDWAHEILSRAEVIVTANTVRRGDSVRRGPDWRWDNQDYNVGQPSRGEIVAYSDTQLVEEIKGVHWVRVRWAAGYANIYRLGPQEYDLVFDY